MLEVLAMRPHRDTAIAAYSKGMRQRILLIAALIHNPEIIIFDEPLSGLDVTSALIFRHLVSALRREGKIILYCSHVLEVVEKVCSHVIILQRGKQVAQGSVEELKHLQTSFNGRDGDQAARALLPSLEAAFSHLVQEVDADVAAREIVSAVL